MVNRIPAYMISSGGAFAILPSRSHPYSSQIMAESARQALEACGVERNDIYIIDCPSDILLPGLSREAAFTGFFSAVIPLAALADDCRSEEAITFALASTDFEVPVVPALVPQSLGQARLAAAAEEAARGAVEMTNLEILLEELAIAASVEILDDLADAEVVSESFDDGWEESTYEPERKKAGRPAGKTGAKPGPKPKTSASSAKGSRTTATKARKSATTSKAAGKGKSK